MIRTYQINDDHIRFIAMRPYKNHSKEHLCPVTKGTFQARSTTIKLVVGIMWKYFGVGGRQ